MTHDDVKLARVPGKMSSSLYITAARKIIEFTTKNTIAMLNTSVIL